MRSVYTVVLQTCEGAIAPQAMKRGENLELLESVKGLAACGSEAATNWEQHHLVSLFIEIERKIEKALKNLDDSGSI